MKRVAVLRGGPSVEYDVSMLSGNAVLLALAESDHPFREITITKDGQWMSGGKKVTPDQALEGIDVAFNALHGDLGEHGQVQAILERKGIPFTGSRAVPSGFTHNKELTKQTLRPHKINLAKHRRVDRTERHTLKHDIAQIIADLGTEVFVKPVSNGSSVGAQRVRDTSALQSILEDLLDVHDQLLVEEYLGGVEATVGVLGDFRGDQLYSFPEVEILQFDNHDFFTYQDKYDRGTSHLTPGRFSPEIKAEMARIAKLAHTEMGCDQYSRSDFIVKDGEVFFLEINSHPALSKETAFAVAADAVGLSFNDLVIHLINTAR